LNSKLNTALRIGDCGWCLPALLSESWKHLSTVVSTLLTFCDREILLT
jgi:hypothetical protein